MSKITAYKAFNSKLQCRDFQFEIGGNYTHEGKVEKCASGFHSCEYPLDMFNYYEPSIARFAEVEASGKIDKEENGDTKIASEKLHVKTELKIADLVTATINYISEKCDKVKTKHATGDWSASSATGYLSSSSATGDRSASSVKGKNSVAINIGIEGKAMADEFGAIVICYHDSEYNIKHIRASKVGENGVKPNVWYQLDADGNFVECD